MSPDLLTTSRKVAEGSSSEVSKGTAILHLEFERCGFPVISEHVQGSLLDFFFETNYH